MGSCKKKHSEIISEAVIYINNLSSDYVLKDGTALMICYGLDRFSEDIDLDGISGSAESIEGIINNFCSDNNYTYGVAKNTDTVKRYMINYGNEGKPLKIEISFRRSHIDPSEILKINDILVYNINSLCIMKSNAYAGRDRIRDLYDLTFIVNKYFDELTPETKALMRSSVEYKGIEHFAYIVNSQKDELIDEGKLAAAFLEMFERLGLLYSKNEMNILGSYMTVKDSNGDSIKENEASLRVNADVKKINKELHTKEKKKEKDISC